jgi:hypothetical protein
MQKETEVGVRLSAGRRDLGRNRLAAFTVALGDDRDCAGRRECLGESAPQPLAGAGDDRDASHERGENDVARIGTSLLLARSRARGSATLFRKLGDGRSSNLKPPAASLQELRARPTASTTTSIRDRAR